MATTVTIATAEQTPLQRGAQSTLHLAERTMSDLNSKNQKLRDAAAAGDKAQVLNLLDSGADINTKDKYGDTPLHEASQWGRVDVAKVLLARGADVNSVGWLGETPLHQASYKGRVAVVEALLAGGADVNAKNNEGETPRDHADSKGFTDVIRVMDKAGTSPNSNPVIFYEKIMALDRGNDSYAIEHLNELSAMVEDPNMLKFFYTLASSLHRGGVLSKQEASNDIQSCLEQSAKLCVCEDSVAMYKLVLKKAVEDGHLSEFDALRLDSRAEDNKTEQTQFVKDIVASVQANTSRIEGLEANVESINGSLNKIRRGIKRKLKVKGVVGMFGAMLNVLSFGAVEGYFSAGMVAFFEEVVDFGDVVHLKAVATDVEARFPEEKLVDQVEFGIEMVETASGPYEDFSLVEEVKKGNVLVMMSANAAMMKDSAFAHSYDSATSHAGWSPGAGGDEVLVEYEGRRSPPTTSTRIRLEEWLSTFVPEEDAAKYRDCLVEDGFDSVEVVKEYVTEEDLSFMKKGHRRILMKKLSEKREA